MRAAKPNLTLNASDLEVVRFFGHDGSCPSVVSSNFSRSPICNKQSAIFSSPSSWVRAACLRAVRTAFLFIFIISAASVAKVKTAQPVEPLLLAIEQVESGGRMNALGDGGRAAGPLQIHKVMVDDNNRIIRRQQFSYADRFNRRKSFAMARIYLAHYGKGMTTLQQFRIWNGGPNGHKKAATLKYAEKINFVLLTAKGQSNG